MMAENSAVSSDGALPVNPFLRDNPAVPLPGRLPLLTGTAAQRPTIKEAQLIDDAIYPSDEGRIRYRAARRGFRVMQMRGKMLAKMPRDKGGRPKKNTSRTR